MSSILTVGALLLSSQAFAQDEQAAAAEPGTPSSAEDAQLGELRERVRLLERSVDDLRGAAEVAPSEIPLDLQTRFRGYGAVNLNYLEEYKVLSFALDEVIFQYTANLDRKMTVNTEISFEPERESVAIGIEQLELILAPKPYFQVSAGAFHLPLSPWAVTASQGAYRYLPTAVPEALEEEPGEEQLPIDQTGLQLRGLVPVGFWQLSYSFAATNGRAPDPGVSPQQLDFGNGKALLGRVALQSPAGFQVGVGGYTDLVDVHDHTAAGGSEHDDEEEIEAATVIDDARETILGASAVWQGGPVELSAEAYFTIHGYEGETYQSVTAFAILGVPVNKTTPYVMVDFIQVDPADPVYAWFNTTGPELESFVGVRHELGLHLALKSQLEVAYELDSQTWGWGLQGQLAAGF